MFTYTRQLSARLRLWLIAAVAVLLFTSVLEAAHVHGVFTELNDHCSLCQHTPSLDKSLTNERLSIQLLLTVFIALGFIAGAVPHIYCHFALSRAPPLHLHSR